MFRRFLIILLLVFTQNSFSQCLELKPPFQEGEEINYLVYYNWGFIWLNAGWVTFSVEPASYQNQDVLHLKGYGASHKSYDWLYKVRDKYQVYLEEESFRPLWFHRQNYEGGYEVDNKYFFNWEENKAFTFTENSNKPFTADTVEVSDCTVDVLSLIYLFRSVDFSELEVYDTVPVVSIIDNEIFDLYIRYLGKETIKDRESKKYNCLKFSALLVEGTIFKGGEDLVVWVTDDQNKIPVLVEAKILVGSVKAYLQSYKGLKFPYVNVE